jgi:pimeloyl-ACP methyl ester carboxylesterase
MRPTGQNGCATTPSPDEAEARRPRVNGVTHVVRLATEAELRVTGPSGAPAVVCVNGGRRAEVPGTWSATLEWLVGRLAPRFPKLAFGEVRYRFKSWRRLDSCVADARAAVAAMSPPRALLVGFSMGGAVAVGAADDPAVRGVLGLAPWFPDRLPLDTLRGRRLAVLHGSLDRYLPGIPGVHPANSRDGFERARALGVEGSYQLIPGALHGIALRAPWGTLVPLPRARAWARLVADELDRFA